LLILYIDLTYIEKQNWQLLFYFVILRDKDVTVCGYDNHGDYADVFHTAWHFRRCRRNRVVETGSPTGDWYWLVRMVSLTVSNNVGSAAPITDTDNHGNKDLH